MLANLIGRWGGPCITDNRSLFSILGPPAPPQDIRIQAGPTPGTLLVSWKPPTLTASGTSNGANVTGYGVYVKGQRVGGIPHLVNSLLCLDLWLEDPMIFY